MPSRALWTADGDEEPAVEGAAAGECGFQLQEAFGQWSEDDWGMRTMEFDERQMAIVDYILEYGRVTNANVQEMFKGPGYR